MVTVSPFLGMGPLPSARTVLVTPMIAAVLEKFLVRIEVFGILVAEVRIEERNMGRSCNGARGVLGLYAGFGRK
jgi:hypothetical protein